MSTLTCPSSVGNLSNLSISPEILHALAVSAKKPCETSRDALKPGAYEICATVQIIGTLSVGVETTATIHKSPDAADILAAVLGKLNAATRAAVLRELPASLDACGYLPESSEEAMAAADILVESLKRPMPQVRRGAVTGKFSVKHLESGKSLPRLSIVG